MPRTESKFATIYGDPCLEFRVLRVRYDKSQSEWAEAIGKDPSTLSRIENGENFPSRDQLLEWTSKLGIDPVDEDLVFISAGYLPRLPKGFGNGRDTRRDHYLLTGAFRELVGRAPVRGLISVLRKRLAEFA